VVNIVKGAVVVHCELSQHLRLVIKLAAHVAGRTFVIDFLLVGTGLFVISILVVLFTESLVVVGTVVVTEHGFGSQPLQYRSVFAEVCRQSSRGLEIFLFVLLVTGNVGRHHGHSVLFHIQTVVVQHCSLGIGVCRIENTLTPVVTDDVL